MDIYVRIKEEGYAEAFAKSAFSLSLYRLNKISPDFLKLMPWLLVRVNWIGLPSASLGRFI
jgi:hypothetical protein